MKRVDFLNPGETYEIYEKRAHSPLNYPDQVLLQYKIITLLNNNNILFLLHLHTPLFQFQKRDKKSLFGG
uniref:Uncharacterized protein n=1 Tax=Meloidogyne enterolobii TaxID=390850 RepID=A0A6V7XSB0_MELEN|nr:unnamed protein product [Meloidogyne enterolobii]